MGFVYILSLLLSKTKYFPEANDDISIEFVCCAVCAKTICPVIFITEIIAPTDSGPVSTVNIPLLIVG